MKDVIFDIHDSVQRVARLVLLLRALDFKSVSPRHADSLLIYRISWFKYVERQGK